MAGRKKYEPTEKDIETVQKIKRLLYDERYTIEGARKKLKERKLNAEVIPFEVIPSSFENPSQ